MRQADDFTKEEIDMAGRLLSAFESHTPGMCRVRARQYEDGWACIDGDFDLREIAAKIIIPL